MNIFRTAFLEELEKVGAKAMATQLTPQSSSVKGFSYDPQSQDMVITYKGGSTYRYKGVTPAAARAMGRNKSVGKAVHKHIKGGGFEYEKISKELTAKGRKQIKPKNFAVPGEEKYPIHDARHARNALARVAQHGTPAEIAKVRAKVHAKYPGIGKEAAREQKNYKCKFCKEPATKGVIWCEGRAIVPCCDKHLVKGKASLDHPSDIDLIRDLTKTSARKFRDRTDRAGENRKDFLKVVRGMMKKFMAKRGLTKKSEDTIGSFLKGKQTITPQNVAQFDTPVSVRAVENLTARARAPWEEQATQGELVIDKIASQRRGIAKMAGACKKQVTWQGLTMKLEHEKGDERSGVNGATGKKWSRVMRDGYGYMPGTYGQGADGEAIDVYFNPDAGDEPVDHVYKIRQKKKTGEYDEDKFMVGYPSAADARKAFLRNMPSWAFGDMTGMSTKSFKTIVGQDQKRAAS